MDDAAALRERDDAPGDPRRRVEVLGAAVHGDARAARDGNPLDRKPEALREVDGGHDAVALGGGERPHPPGRIRQDQHASHALGDLVGGRAHDAEDGGGRVLAVGAVSYAHRPRLVAFRIEVVLLERGGGTGAVAACDHTDDLVRVDVPPPARLDHLALVVRRRLERGGLGLAHRDLHAAPGEIAHDQLDGLGRRAPHAVAEPEPDHDLLQPQVPRRRRKPLGDLLESRRIQRDRRADDDGDAVPVQAPTRIARAPQRAERARRLVKQPLEASDVHSRVVRLVGGPTAHLGEHEQPLVLGHRTAPSPEAVHVVRSGQALEDEAPEAREADACGDLRVQPEEARVLARTGRPGNHRAVHVATAPAAERHRAALGRQCRRVERIHHRRDDGLRILAILVGHHHFDRGHGGPSGHELARRDRAAYPLDRASRARDRARHPDYHPPVGEVDALGPHRSGANRRERHQLVGREEAEQVSGERDVAPMGVGLEQPASHAVEDLPGRGREVEQHRLRRWARASGRAREPRSNALGGEFGALLEGGALEDRGVRLDGGVGQRIGNQRPHRRDAAERVRERGVVGEPCSRARERGEAAQHGTHQLAPQLRNVLRREQPEQRPLERIAVNERRHTVVSERRTQQSAEVLPGPGTPRAHATHEASETRGVRRTDLAAGSRSRRGEKQLLEVGENDDLVLQRGEVAGERRRERAAVGGVEQRGEPPRPLRVGVVPEQHGADLLTQRSDRGSPLACLPCVQGREIGRAGTPRRVDTERIGVRAERQP